MRDNELLFNFFYYSLERYRLSAEQAAKKMLEEDNPARFIEVINRCINENNIQMPLPSFWKEAELLQYLRDFISHYEKYEI